MQRFISSTSGGPPAPATEASEETEGDAAVKWVRSTLSQLKRGVTKQKGTQAGQDVIIQPTGVGDLEGETVMGRCLGDRVRSLAGPPLTHAVISSVQSLSRV